MRDQGLPLPTCVFFFLSLYLWVFLTVFPTRCLLARLVSKYLFPSRFLPISASWVASFPAGVLQASELGMISAFYKYILTTMVRTPSSPSDPFPPMVSAPMVPGPASPFFSSQDFPILHLDGIVEDSSNILGFSMFNTSHPFYPEFVRSLNMSWRENCEASTYPGPAVSTPPRPPHTDTLHTDTLGPFKSLPVGAQSLWCSHSLPKYVPRSLILR